MSALHLREALPGDAAAVNACVQAAYAPWVERIGRKPLPMLQDYALVIREQHVVIAEADGELAGVLVLAETDEGFLIDNVAVPPQEEGSGHRQGIARPRGARGCGQRLWVGLSLYER